MESSLDSSFEVTSVLVSHILTPHLNVPRITLFFFTKSFTKDWKLDQHQDELNLSIIITPSLFSILQSKCDWMNSTEHCLRARRLCNTHQELSNYWETFQSIVYQLKMHNHQSEELWFRIQIQSAIFSSWPIQDIQLRMAVASTGMQNPHRNFLTHISYQTTSSSWFQLHKDLHT